MDILLQFLFVLTQSAQMSVNVSTQNYIPPTPLNWQVGQEIDYDLSLGFWGHVGTSTKMVVGQEVRGYWIKQVFNVPFRNEVLEVLISRESGQMLRMIHNGSEQGLPDQTIEISEQGEVQLTVPAGQFNAWHILGKTHDTDHLEVWLNSSVAPIDGAIKQNIQLNVGQVTMEMTGLKN